jgi:hypothetical protein
MCCYKKVVQYFAASSELRQLFIRGKCISGQGTTDPVGTVGKLKNVFGACSHFFCISGIVFLGEFILGQDGPLFFSSFFLILEDFLKFNLILI